MRTLKNEFLSIAELNSVTNIKNDGSETIGFIDGLCQIVYTSNPKTLLKIPGPVVIIEISPNHRYAIEKLSKYSFSMYDSQTLRPERFYFRDMQNAVNAALYNAAVHCIVDSYQSPYYQRFVDYQNTHAVSVANS